MKIEQINKLKYVLIDEDNILYNKTMDIIKTLYDDTSLYFEPSVTRIKQEILSKLATKEFFKEHKISEDVMTIILVVKSFIEVEVSIGMVPVPDANNKTILKRVNEIIYE